ncbi:VOC family protein [Streptomyces sp. HNM0663]|uniref:VOC family protein n=1 Tax=Streptomyces chengmaiensis TaxID=3040919 RepID=A0ABT6HPN3_9ACTN|nr:VOC family protein [Streptomyces chengmaiensis]MDH2390242.1 VOC family protein [Streptomyces chengmaiensis]
MDKESTAADPRATSSEDVYGAPCWISLMAHDLSAAQDFYGAVLGWRFRPARLGAEFRLAVLDGEPVAGIGEVTPTLQAPVAWTPYFAVADADATAARIRERSATVAVGPLNFPVGRGALAADRDGAVFGIWQGELISNWQTWREKAPTWLRLRTRNAFDAAIFYGEVLDWASDRPGCCEVDYEEDEVVLRQHGFVVARLSSGATEEAPDPLIRPHWHVHFAVPDVEATVQAALRHGGLVLEQHGTPEGSEATLRDRDGAMFSVNDGSHRG